MGDQIKFFPPTIILTKKWPSFDSLNYNYKINYTLTLKSALWAPLIELLWLLRCLPVLWEATTILAYFTILINFYKRSKLTIVLKLDKKDFHALNSCEIEGSYILLKVIHSYWFTWHIQKKCCAGYRWKLSCNAKTLSQIKYFNIMF